MVNSDDNNVSETESLSNEKTSTQTIDQQMANGSEQKDILRFNESSTTSSEDCVKSTLPLVIPSIGECLNSDDVTNKKHATGGEDKSTDPLCATDEAISLLPPGLQRQGAISNAVPGAFRVGDPSLADDGVNQSIPDDRDLSFANMGTSQSSLDQHSHNDSILGIYSTPLEATLVTIEETREPTVMSATVNKDIVYAEILDNRIDKEHELREKEQNKKRKRIRWVIVGVLFFTLTILVSVGTTILLDRNDEDSDVNYEKPPKPENSQDRDHHYESVTHHAVILGGQSTCTHFTPGILKLYCGGITEVNNETIAMISMSDQGLQCQRIGSNTMSCDTSILTSIFEEDRSNSSLQTGFIFSCGRKHYIDNSKVAAAAFLSGSEGSECLSLNSSNVTMEDTPEAFNFIGLGHFCRAQASESDSVTWTLTDNMPMLDGKKILQCETTTAGFISSISNSLFDYCFQSNRSCSSSASNSICSSLKLGAMNATDKFDKCENRGKLDEFLFQELKLVLNEVMRENEQNLLSQIITHNLTEETR